MYTSNQSENEKTLLSDIIACSTNSVSLLVQIHHMCTLDSYAILYYHRVNRSLSVCLSESVSLRYIGKPASHAKISSPSFFIT